MQEHILKRENFYLKYRFELFLVVKTSLFKFIVISDNYTFFFGKVLLLNLPKQIRCFLNWHQDSLRKSLWLYVQQQCRQSVTPQPGFGHHLNLFSCKSAGPWPAQNKITQWLCPLPSLMSERHMRAKTTSMPLSDVLILSFYSWGETWCIPPIYCQWFSAAQLRLEHVD